MHSKAWMNLPLEQSMSQLVKVTDREGIAMENRVRFPPPSSGRALNTWQSFKHRPHFAAELFGFGARWGLGDDADDRFGVAGADVDPAIGPVQAQAIDRV